jgi:hypothetical protein
MSIEVTPPVDGRVILDMNWEDAEILLRVLGMVNTVSLRTHSPDLLRAVERLIAQFGRSTPNEANRFLVEVSREQLFITDITKSACR